MKLKGLWRIDMDHPPESVTVAAAVQESSLLLTLEEVSQLISHSHNPHETLDNIVRLIQGRFATDVASVYLLEPESGELVLAATVGLEASSVGRVRMKLSEGLTGMVAERMSPIMEEDAFTHPRFKYFPEAGEDPYHSFLGVPVIESGSIQGVLVVQTADRRRFSANEIRMLITVGSQLAPLVSGAQMLESVAHADREEAGVAGAGACRTRELEGTPLSPGTGLGRAYVIGERAEPAGASQSSGCDPGAEAQRLRRAMDGAREEITRLSRKISLLVGEDHGAILQAQLMILQDSSVERDLAACLLPGASAENAVLRTLDKYIATFQKLSNPYFRERIFDVKDVFRRVLWHLRPGEDAAGPQPGEGRLILVAHEASVLDLFAVDLDHLDGVVVEHGGPQSHAVIIARSLGIPMVGRVEGLLGRIENGQLVQVDGASGRVVVEPPPGARAEQGGGARPCPDVDAGDHAGAPGGLDGEAGPAGGTNGLAAAEGLRGTPAPAAEAETPGLPRIEANVNLLSEAARVRENGAQGVGLYRSEMLFLARRTLPTEEEQVEIYRKLVETLRGRPVTIRTFDLRPDKLGHGAAATQSAAQKLDWRLVLESPLLQRLFKEQVRAIFRAGTAGPVRLLVPLVTRASLLDFAVAIAEEARRELLAEGLPFDGKVPLGMMVEAAAVAPMVEEWASRVDFVALGTNDLIASAMGTVREDPVGAQEDDLLHPGLVRMIGEMIAAAHRAGRTVSVCGEMASHPEGAVVLAALGVDSLSLAVDRVQAVRQVLRRRDPKALGAIRGGLLEAKSVEQVRRLIA
ncbi:Phosphoenolpyruvate-protein phosphotransferase [Aquisphaera giovannonii]|uniref:Phosphoenolpyruvate-protein phosphotransferase n=1 Tax=Aquisphaera giovannonii TaxID=406548 RepID=A0A5B9W4F4_9BACT|nr:putative PEP-binding protein [Aquisphaera giovannonii]QEH35438.1 Phosphoenolpyruvate-protein phosphotransferase [Aquisphaera giovannonii]